MNKYIFLTVTVCAAVGAAWTGCSSSSTTGGSGTAGSGGKSTSSTSKMSTTTTSMSSAMGVTSGGGSGVGGSGFGGSGVGGGAVGIQCNPVTNAGCQSGEACDIAVDPNTGMVDGFQCYPPPNDAMVCGACDPSAQNGPFCAGGSTCVPLSTTVQQCAHYCCSDADCGAGGVCDVMAMLFAPASTTLGICVAGPSTGTGGSGTGGSGAGGGSGTISLACSPPSSAPSNGSCVTVGM